MNIVLGARGRLGRAIASSFENGQVQTPDRSDYGDWWREGSEDTISRYLEKAAGAQDVVYLAAGIIDPKRPEEEHQRVNFELARNLIVGATRLGLKVVTFGTVMEKVVGDSSDNPYFSSKTKLSRFVDGFCVDSPLALHVRIHTLYGGGPPEKFMFLGQILDAIRNRTDFKMTLGTQLREYHHIDDEVTALTALTAAATSGVIELSHGCPVRLCDLASYIFTACDSKPLLKIGAIPEPAKDNFGMTFERPAALDSVAFRDALPAVVEYLRAH
jgi:nucleoside-diphosphate-sugar epimerase